jgi:hypothetical protein
VEPIVAKTINEIENASGEPQAESSKAASTTPASVPPRKRTVLVEVESDAEEAQKTAGSADHSHPSVMVSAVDVPSDIAAEDTPVVPTDLPRQRADLPVPEVPNQPLEASKVNAQPVEPITPATSGRNAAASTTATAMDAYAPQAVDTTTAPKQSAEHISAEPKDRTPRKVRIELEEETTVESVVTSSRDDEESGTQEREAFRPRHSVPMQQTPLRQNQTPDRSSAIGGASFTTPHLSTPLKRSLVLETIMSSEKKRQRSIDRAAGRGPRRSTMGQYADEGPDTVMASTKFPSSQLHTAPEHVPPPLVPSGPALTPEEWHEKVEAGKMLVKRQQEEYRRHIAELCAMFSLTPGELVRVVNELPKKARGGEMYWKDVEHGLRQYLRR